MYVARSEWKDSECNEYIGCSSNLDRLAEKVIKWAKSAKEEGYVEFSQYSNDGEMKNALINQGAIASDGAYDIYADDWVCYMIDEVEEL